ncbi:MAG: hypothetical protein ABR512_10990 [Desulfopila sp.]
MESTDEPAEKDIADNITTVSYITDEEGNQERVSSSYWQPVNVVNHQAWQEIEKQTARSKQRIQTGQVSCLHYYMTVNQMTAGLLAKYTGQSGFMVRLHLLPFVFTRLRRKTLEIYADFFKVGVEDLVHGNLKPPIYQQPEHGRHVVD